MNVMNGFVVPYPLIPPWFQWLNRLVPTTWVVYGLTVSQLGGLPNAVAWGGSTISVTTFLSEVFAYDVAFMPWTLLICVLYIIFFRAASALALKYLNFLRR